MSEYFSNTLKFILVDVFVIKMLLFLLDIIPEKIILVGDSAGGNLCVGKNSFSI